VAAGFKTARSRQLRRRGRAVSESDPNVALRGQGECLHPGKSVPRRGSLTSDRPPDGLEDMGLEKTNSHIGAWGLPPRNPNIVYCSGR